MLDYAETTAVLRCAQKWDSECVGNERERANKTATIYGVFASSGMLDYAETVGVLLCATDNVREQADKTAAIYGDFVVSDAETP